MTTVMITGANRGLGLEFVRQYVADGCTVIATCRNPDAADDLNSISGVKVHELNVTDLDAVGKLAAKLKGTAIDVLINNAGIYGPKGYTLAELDFGIWEQVLRTNTLAPLRVAQCFAPHVAASKTKCIATLSSKMGSMADNTSGGSYIYRSSKAALNAVMKSLSHDLASQGVISLILHPGWVRTDMGGAGGLIDAKQSVTGMRDVIAQTRLSRSGAFYNYDGTEIPW